MRLPPPRSTLFPYTTLFRSDLWICIADLPFRGASRVGTRADLGYRSARLFPFHHVPDRSEEHTSELQSRFDLVCRLLLEKKKSLTFHFNFIVIRSYWYSISC